MTATNPLRILITGCSSGIGYYCAKTLHQQGHRLSPVAASKVMSSAYRTKALTVC